MEFKHNIARKALTGEEYEMDYFACTFSLSDLPVEFLKSVKPVQAIRTLEYLLQREMISLQMQSGHISLEAAAGKAKFLLECLTVDLQEKVISFGL